MRVNGNHYRTVWMENSSVFMIQQNLLPFQFQIYEAKSCQDTCEAIKTMIVRGAGAIGAAAGFALAQAFYEGKEDIEKARKQIEQTRPTARDLFYATERVYEAAKSSPHPAQAAFQEAQQLAEENVQACKLIGQHGAPLLDVGKWDVNILTHCNAGWLAFVDYGTALASVYHVHGNKEFGYPSIHIYVSETRPRGQGARLTAWELQQQGLPHTIIADSAAASLMARGKIDLVLVGADRIARNYDTANKIGTLEKAILAKEFYIPFCVAAPTSTIDNSLPSGAEIPIEERSQDELLYQEGPTAEGKLEKILICSPGSRAYNPAFDVTPAKYISAIITEKGMIKPAEISRLLL